MAQAWKLVITIDVEEEGLFSGKYPRTPPGVTNVAQLRRLEFITREFGVPLTLLVTYRVAQNPAAQEVLNYFREHYRAEIGAHLHPWNTPPFQKLSDSEPVRSNRIPLSLMQAKFESLIEILHGELSVSPSSFRMGRFDMSAQVASLLPRYGLKVDSSMVPFRQEYSDGEYFLIPSDPFFLNISGNKSYPLLETPLTIVPVWAGLPRLISHFSTMLPDTWGNLVKIGFPYVSAAGIQPVWFPLLSMQEAVRWHRRQGGRVLTMFLHSSELQAGASPCFPTELAVTQLIKKIRSFLVWLKKQGPVQGLTLSELHQDEAVFQKACQHHLPIASI